MPPTKILLSFAFVAAIFFSALVVRSLSLHVQPLQRVRRRRSPLLVRWTRFFFFPCPLSRRREHQRLLTLLCRQVSVIVSPARDLDEALMRFQDIMWQLKDEDEKLSMSCLRQWGLKVTGLPAQYVSSAFEENRVLVDAMAKKMELKPIVLHGNSDIELQDQNVFDYLVHAADLDIANSLLSTDTASFRLAVLLGTLLGILGLDCRDCPLLLAGYWLAEQLKQDSELRAKLKANKRQRSSIRSSIPQAMSRRFVEHGSVPQEKCPDSPKMDPTTSFLDLDSEATATDSEEMVGGEDLWSLWAPRDAGDVESQLLAYD